MASEQTSSKEDVVLQRQKALIMDAARLGMSNLIRLAINENPKVDLQTLLEPSSPGEVPLVVACLNGHLEVAKELVETCKASLTSTGDMEFDGLMVKNIVPLWTASKSGKVELVKYLVERGADISQRTSTGSTPLRAACFDGYLPVVQYLVDHGADVNAVNADGHSVLMAACYKEREDVARFLLDRGTDVNYAIPEKGPQSGAGRTALFDCAGNGNVPIATLLVGRGARVNQPDLKGFSALMAACSNNHKDFASFLLDEGADVNYAAPDIDGSDISGDTALHRCCLYGKVDTVKLLLDRGATITHNKHDETPLTMAAHNGQEDMVNVMGDSPDCSRDDKADALELLGCDVMALKDHQASMDKAFGLWERAMELRHCPGKPVAEKRLQATVPAFGDAVEVQTMAELNALKASRNVKEEVLIHAMLISERVLGQSNWRANEFVTTFAMRMNILMHRDRAFQILLHVQNNLSKSQHPRFNATVVGVHVTLLVSLYGLKEQKNEQTYSPERVIQGLNLCIADFTQREQVEKKFQGTIFESTDLSHRCNMLKTILQYMHFATTARKDFSAGEEQTFLDTVTAFVQTDIRGPKGEALLHMAVDEETTKPSEHWTGWSFPSKDVVKLLLETGCDVNAQNETGQTALQFLKEKCSGKHSDIVALLSA